MKKESQFQTEFGRWVKHRWGYTAAFELKIVPKGKGLPFSSVRPNQRVGLTTASNGKMYYKLPDVGLTPKPFDCVVLVQEKAYVVIQYYARGVKHFYVVESNAFFDEAKRSKSRSLTEKRAGVIGQRFSFE